MQCGNCRSFFEFTLESRYSVPKIRVVPKDVHFDIIESGVFFGLEAVEGERTR